MTYLMTKRELRLNWGGGKLVIEGPNVKGSTAPAGTIVPIPKADEDRILADGGLMSDMIVLDDQTAHDLLAAQERQRAALAAQAAHVRAQREAAEQAERERQDRAAALVNLALSAVPVPEEVAE